MRFAVGVNTMHPNTIVADALTERAIPELTGYSSIRREVKYGEGLFGRASRVDLLLAHPHRPPCYLGVKNVHTMRRPGLAEFPDSVTLRARYLEELAAVAASGGRAVMLFVIQIGSSMAFGVARDIDPAYGRAFDRARAAGVEAIAYSCRLSRDGGLLAGPVPIEP
jgi:sugar fermentation stimulation protein A